MKVFVPNKADNAIDEILKELYLLKVALSVEDSEKIKKRIDDLRGKVLDLKNED